MNTDIFRLYIASHNYTGKLGNWRVVWAFFLILLPALGCGLLNQVENPAAAYGVEREESLFLLGGQPRTLDPALTHGGPAGPLGHLFSGLVTLDPQLQLQPDLASGWSVSDDGTVYTFYLRPQAVFHDGRPVTAQDIIFSWERAANPATGSDTAETYLGDITGFAAFQNGAAPRISGLQALDERTLQVTIDSPKPYFLAKLTYPVAFVVDRENVSRPDWEREPNGTGPYRLLAWEDDEIMVLERNEAYYGPPAGTPHVVLLMGAGIPLSLYETDQIDLVGIGSGTLERVQDPNDPLAPDLVTGAGMCTDYIGLDNTRPPFDNPLVRRAFNLAIDRDRLVTALAGGNALVANSILPPGMPGYQTRPESYPYDPEAARALLEEAGYPPGTLPELTYTTAGYGNVGAQATALISMWQENLGVAIRPVSIDPFTYNDTLYSGETGHLFDSGWCADYPDPQNFLDTLFHSTAPQNLGHFSDPGIDALLEAARVEPDVTRRLELYAEAETALLEAAPAVLLTHPLYAALVKPYIQNYTLTPIGVPYWHLLKIER